MALKLLLTHLHMLTKDQLHLAQQILAYLVEHPESQDTLEGIVEWWLLERHIRNCIPQVKATIDELCAQGLLEARQGEDKSVRYRLSTRKRPLRKSRAR